MDNYNLIFAQDPYDGDLPKFNYPMLKDNVKNIVDEAVRSAEINTKVTIECFEHTVSRFRKLWTEDPDHLSNGTAIGRDVVYFSPLHILFWYCRNMEYCRVIRTSIPTKKKMNYSWYLKRYIINVLTQEIRRFAGLDYDQTSIILNEKRQLIIYHSPGR